MPTGLTDVNAMAREFRRDVLRREAAARQTMYYSWTAARGSIANEMDALLREVERRGVRTANELYRLERYERFHEFAQGQVVAYSAASQREVVSLVEWSAKYGGESAARMMDGIAGHLGVAMTMPNPDAVMAMAGRVVHGGAATAFKTLPAGAVQATERALIGGIALGKNANAVARDMRRAMDITAYNAQRIARTETMTAYRAAHTETYRANKRLLDGWRWDAALDDRTCDICWSMDGTMHPADATLDTHVNCRCWQTPVPLGYEDMLREGWREDGPTLFNQLSEEDQLRILGPGRLTLYREGMPLKDMQRVVRDPFWGPTRQRIPLRELRPAPVPRRPAPSRPPAAPTMTKGGYVPTKAQLKAERDVWARTVSSGKEHGFTQWADGSRSAVVVGTKDSVTIPLKTVGAQNLITHTHPGTLAQGTLQAFSPEDVLVQAMTGTPVSRVVTTSGTFTVEYPGKTPEEVFESAFEWLKRTLGGRVRVTAAQARTDWYAWNEAGTVLHSRARSEFAAKTAGQYHLDDFTRYEIFQQSYRSEVEKMVHEIGGTVTYGP